MRMGNIRGNIGAASELIVAADLVAKGHEVYRALNPQGNCDLLCMLGEQPIRIEVKTARYEKSGTLVAGNLKGREGRFDVLAIVSSLGEIQYFSAAGIIGNEVRIKSISEVLRAGPGECPAKMM